MLASLYITSKFAPKICASPWAKVYVLYISGANLSSHTLTFCPIMSQAMRKTLDDFTREVCVLAQERFPADAADWRYESLQGPWIPALVTLDRRYAALTLTADQAHFFEDFLGKHPMALDIKHMVYSRVVDRHKLKSRWGVEGYYATKSEDEAPYYPHGDAFPKARMKWRRIGMFFNDA